MRRDLGHVLAPLIFALGFILFAGCASAPFKPGKAKPATVEQLRRMGAANNGLDCLLYSGSDAESHYFHHARLGGGGTYRLPRSEWKPRKEFPLGQEHATEFPRFPAAAR